MSHYRKGKPYIRRGHPRDTAGDMCTAVRIAFLAETRGEGNYYVLVQHAIRGKVLEVARTKAALKRSILPVAVGRIRFREWQRRLHWRTDYGKHAPSARAGGGG